MLTIFILWQNPHLRYNLLRSSRVRYSKTSSRQYSSNRNWGKAYKIELGHSTNTQFSIKTLYLHSHSFYLHIIYVPYFQTSNFRKKKQWSTFNTRTLWQKDFGNFNHIFCKNYALDEILSRGTFVLVLIKNHTAESASMNIHTMLPQCIQTELNFPQKLCVSWNFSKGHFCLNVHHRIMWLKLSEQISILQCDITLSFNHIFHDNYALVKISSRGFFTSVFIKESHGAIHMGKYSYCTINTFNCYHLYLTSKITIR